MKILLIYPPQWNPMSPFLSVPMLAGQLKKAGYEADTADLNVRFYNRILNSRHLKKCLKEAENLYSSLSEKIEKYYQDAEGKFSSYTLSEQTLLLKYRKLAQFLDGNLSQLNRADYSCGNTARYTGERMSLSEIIDSVDEAVRVMRNPKDFYDPEKLFDAKMIVQEALKIASLPYAPNELIWDNYFANPLLKMNWENIDSQCNDRSVNMFIDFFEEISEEIADENYDLIGISVPDLSQIIPAFTLAGILKKKTSAHVFAGGNYITQNEKEFASHPEIFGNYVDSFMVGDGDIAIVNMAEYIDGKKDVSLVPGLMYKDGERVTVNAPAPKLKMDEVAFADFDGYDFSLYYSPDIVMPFQFSKGCYWGKCEFCDYYYGQQCFDIKNTQRALEEILYYKKKYGVKHFLFIDEAIPPVYYDKFADAVIASGEEIYFYSFARLEKQFTLPVLEKLFRAGLRILMWGYECSAPRLLKMMNKGIDPDTRLEIMENAHKAGIWNNALFIIGYPTETPEEINETLRVIESNREIINSCTPSNFSLKKNAIIMSDPYNSGVKSYAENGEFYTVYKDEIDGVTQQQRREIRRDFHKRFVENNKYCLWPVSYSDFDSTLLYLSKHGPDYVMNYRSGRAISPSFR